MEKILIDQANKTLEIKNSMLNDSRIVQSCMERLYFEDVNLSGTKITDANLSDLEISNAQLGGAYIHDIGIPSEGHPNYKPWQQPVLKFENCNLAKTAITNCNLTKTEITDCNLSGVSVSDCNLSGMTINGIPVEELLKQYKK